MYYRRYDGTGAALAEAVSLKAGAVNSLAMDADAQGDFAIAWADGAQNDEHFAHYFAPDGAAQGERFNFTAEGSVYFPAVAMQGDGQFVAAFAGQSPVGIDARRFQEGSTSYKIVPVGDATTAAFGINNAGQVTGLSGPPGALNAFLWQAGQLTSLGPAGRFSQGYAVGPAGQVVGDYCPTGPNQAFLYAKGQYTDLGTLGGQESQAFGVNQSSLVVGESQTAGGDQHAFVNSKGKMTDINGLLGGSQGSSAYNVNDSGVVVGGYVDAQGQGHAFLYKAGQVTHLPVGLIEIYQDAFGGLDVNNKGQVVGTHTVSGVSRAFLYSGGQATDLASLDGLPSVGRAINNLGQAVGAAQEPSDQRAITWLNGAAVALDSLIPVDSGWDALSFAYGINDSGWIVGVGTYLGQPASFVLKPAADLVPSDLSLSTPNANLAPGDKGTLTVRVTNQGLATAVGTIQVPVMASTDPTDQSATNVLGQSKVSIKLAPGQSKLIKIAVAVPPTLPAGDYYLLAHVDSTNVIDEGDDANNWLASAATTNVAWKFGTFDTRKNYTITVADQGGVLVSFGLSGGGSGEIQPGATLNNIVVSSSTVDSKLTIATRTKGATATVTNVGVDGPLKSLSAKTVNFNGELKVTGALASLLVGDVSDGTVKVGSSDPARGRPGRQPEFRPGGAHGGQQQPADKVPIGRGVDRLRRPADPGPGHRVDQDHRGQARQRRRPPGGPEDRRHRPQHGQPGQRLHRRRRDQLPLGRGGVHRRAERGRHGQSVQGP